MFALLIIVVQFYYATHAHALVYDIICESFTQVALKKIQEKNMLPYLYLTKLKIQSSNARIDLYNTALEYSRMEPRIFLKFNKINYLLYQYTII